MRSITPPRIPKWLLRHFGCSPHNDAIIGDLNERYGHHQSRTWYWKQALAALMTGFCREAWRNRLMGCGPHAGQIIENLIEQAAAVLP